MFKNILILLLLCSPVFACDTCMIPNKKLEPMPVTLPNAGPTQSVGYPQRQYVQIIPSTYMINQKNPWTIVPSQGLEKTHGYINIYPGTMSH